MMWISVVLVAAVAVFLMIYYWLAPQNRWFTFVQEGTAKIIVRGDAFQKALIQWSDRTFRGYTEQVEGVEEKWEVVERKGLLGNVLGGFRLYSLLHPLDKVYTYQHRWIHLHPNGEVRAHEERMDFIFLREDLYVIELPLAEEGGTEDINGVPMGIKIALPMRIINPYIATFRVGRWLAMVTGIIQARFRRFVSSYRYKEDLLNMRAGKDIKDVQEKAGIPEDDRVSEGTDLWDIFWRQTEEDFRAEGGEISGDGAKRIIRIYGVQIVEKGARVLAIDPSPRYRELTTIEYEAHQQRRKTEITAKARAAEIMGTVIEAVASAEGRGRREVEAEFGTDPRTFYEKHKTIIDNVMTKLAMESRAYVRIETPGATGALGDLLRLAAAWKRMPGGGGSVPEPASEPKPAPEPASSSAPKPGSPPRAPALESKSESKQEIKASDVGYGLFGVSIIGYVLYRIVLYFLH